MVGTDARKANFRNANLYFIRPGSANFSGANFEGANLNRAICREADFSGANLTGANIEGAVFERARLVGLTPKELDLSKNNTNGAEF